MLVMGIHPGHDGGIVAIEDRQLLFYAEAEKDSFPRHAKTTPMNMLDALELMGRVPDVVAMGGSYKEWFPATLPVSSIGVGYYGAHEKTEREGMLCGKRVKYFSGIPHPGSHHDGRGHGTEGRCSAASDAVLGGLRRILLSPRRAAGRSSGRSPCCSSQAGATRRYSRSPSRTTRTASSSRETTPASSWRSPPMAIQTTRIPRVVDAIDRLMSQDGYFLTKGDYRDVPFYNTGVESDVAKSAAALIHHRMFQTFAEVAQKEIPPDIPLYISGGCGLNCDWNEMFRELGHFSSVFVPPCANDSGSAIGTALDALHAITGDPRIDWDVYCGLEFEWDQEPDPAKWQRRPMKEAEVADAIAAGSVVAWVQGRYELGPRALGNRSLLAEPFHESTKDLLNDIKLREGYRPIAPCCRLEDVLKVYDRDYHDPYMLHFRMATTPDLKAVTHVDGSARVQTVTKESNRAQHDLLSAFAERHGVGVLCNTSLNYKGMGFINRTSDLVNYCESRGVSDMVVGDAWFQRVNAPVRLNGPAQNTRLVKSMIEQHVPEGSTVLVISEGIDEMLNLEGRSGWHFPQNEDGSFQDHHPADSQEVIAKLEELREKGASHLAISRSDFWWLDFYSDFQQHLETRYRPVLDDRRGLIFALEPAGLDQ